jgi:hypothetical protein
VPANVKTVMALNADPKPGRWVLPLVILGMITFTYYFVRELPAASPDTTLPGAGATTTLPDDTTTTTEAPTLDPQVQAYLDAIDEINSHLQLLQTDLVAANTGFDATPREVEYQEAVQRFTAVRDDTIALLGQFDELTAPEGLEAHHAALRNELDEAAQAAAEALSGLQSADPGIIRRAGVDRYVLAAGNFSRLADELQDAAAAL